MTPYKILYERKCRRTLCRIELGKKIIGSEIVQEEKKYVKFIKEKIKEVADRQKSYVDLKRKDFSLRCHLGRRF